MTLIIICLLVTVGVFGGICIHLNERIQNANFVIDALAKDVNYLKQKADLNTKSIELQNKSIRERLDIIKKIVEDKETIEPDTKALISGWNADEIDKPELVSTEEFKKNIVDIMLNGTYEQKQYLINTMTLQNILLGQTQQCNYHTLQSTLLGQTQQCIYPWQPWRPGQFQLGAMLKMQYGTDGEWNEHGVS